MTGVITVTLLNNCGAIDIKTLNNFFLLNYGYNVSYLFGYYGRNFTSFLTIIFY